MAGVIETKEENFLCTSTRTLNKSVSRHLPSSNDQITLCLRDFTKMILNMNPRGDNCPRPPTRHEVDQFQKSQPIDPLSDTNFFQAPSNDIKFYGGRKSIPGKYKEQCQKELEHYGITVPTFQWEIQGITDWDKFVLAVIVKYWLHAKDEGTFSNYAIDTEYSRYDILFGLSERWLRGQKDGFKKPKLRTKFSKSRVKQKIFQHRLSTANKILGPNKAKALLPGVECCSDTEQEKNGEYESLSVQWRSQIYSDFLHNLDNNTLNCLYELKGKVKAMSSIEYNRKYTSKAQEHDLNPSKKLPSNCYSQIYLNRLNWTEKLVLEMADPDDGLEKISKTLETNRWFD